MPLIYLIRNLVSGKGYVGQTEMSVARRWSGHKSSARCGKGNILHNAMRKYGFENFSITEVVVCDSSALNDLETHYIKFYGTHHSIGHGYNMSEGGECPPNHSGKKRSAETRLRMSIAAKNRPPVSLEHRARMSAISKSIGHAPSAEARQKARLRNTGVPRAAHVTAAVIAALTGKNKSSEEIGRRQAVRRANALRAGRAY